jgi:hypothetical protein
MFDVDTLPVEEISPGELVPDPVEFPVDGVPADLDSWVPGPFLADVLSSVDRSRLSAHDLVTLLRAEARLISHLQARHQETLVRIWEAERESEACGGLDEELVWASTVAEIEAGLALTRRSAEARLSFAAELLQVCPLVWEGLLRGQIDAARAHVIVQGLAGVSGEVAKKVTDQILEKASRWTTGQLRARIRKLVVEADPEDARDKYEAGLEERRVVVEANPDGTADLSGYELPADRVAEARDRINRIARTLKTGDEPRTLDQIRADVFLDLLCGSETQNTSTGRRGVVDIRVDLSTLAGLAESPGEIPGYGPVIADIARQIAQEHGSTWQVTLTHGGAPVWVGTTRRRPSAQLARRVRARYPVCVFPGCRMPARACDLDHNQAVAEGGATHETNLAPLCRRHHIIRHHGWTLKRLPDGSFRWASPLGHTYIVARPP